MTVRIEYQHRTADTDRQEYEIVKAYATKYSLDNYLDFKKALYSFWQDYIRSGTDTVDTPNNVGAIELKFFGEGLTDALVFRAEVFFENCGGSSFIRVMKYDTFKNIKKEVSCYLLTAGRRDSSIFPGLEKDCLKQQPNGMALLSMRSVIDSAGASSSHTLIQYILEKYCQHQDYLNLYGDKISHGLACVYGNMEEDFYLLNRNLSFFNDKTLYQYFCDSEKGKINLAVLDSKTAGKFAEAYNNCQKFLKERLELQLPIVGDFFDGINDEVKKIPVLLTTHAIHGDFNPNNILMAVAREASTEVIYPMVIDFAEVKFRNNPDTSTWTPLFYDPARLEAELMIRYFHALDGQKGLGINVIWHGMKLVLKCLHQGRFLEIRSSALEHITDNELNFIFRIIYHFRARIFDAWGGIADIDGYDRKTAMINYIWCVMAFCFYYLKFTKEENIEEKKPLALAMADFYRRNLPDLLNLNIDSCYSKTRMQTLGLFLIQGRMEAFTRHYIDIQNEVEQVIRFVLSDNKKHLLIIGSPGTGKTSLASYLTRLLNGDINLPEYLKLDKKQLDNLFCIPYISGEMRYERTTKDGNRESGEYSAIEWFSERLVSLFPELKMAAQDNESPAFDRIFDGYRPNLLERFKRLLKHAGQILIERNQRIVFMIDGLDVYNGTIEEFLIAESCANICFVYTSRSEKPIIDKLATLSGYSDPMELSFFSEPDLRRYLERIGLTLESIQLSLLFEKSRGWQIYIEKACGILRDAENKKQTLMDFSPGNINLIYELIINNKITGAGEDEVAGLAVLFTLSQAREPLDMDQLIVINQEYLKKICMTPHIQKGLAMCRQLIRVTETGAYSIFHDTAKDYVMSTYREDLKEHQKVFSACIVHTLTQPEQNALFGYALRNAGIHLYSWGMEDRLISLLEVICGSNNGKEGVYDEIMLNLLDYQIPKEPSPEGSRLKTLIEKAVEHLPGFLMIPPLWYMTNRLDGGWYLEWVIYLSSLFISLNEKQFNQSCDWTDLYFTALAYSKRGVALSKLDELAAAVADYNRAIDLLEKIKVQRESNGQLFTSGLITDLAHIYSNRGAMLNSQNEWAASVADYNRAIDLLEKIKVQCEPNGQFAYAYLNHGHALREQGEFAAAVADYNRAIGIIEELKVQNESNGQLFTPDLILNLAIAYLCRGNGLSDRGEWAAAVADHNRAIDLLEKIKAQCESNGQLFTSDLILKFADTYLCRGNVLSDQGELAASVADYNRAIDLLEKIKVQCESNGQLFTSDLILNLAKAYSFRGDVLHEQGGLAAAFADHNRAIDLLEKIKVQCESNGQLFTSVDIIVFAHCTYTNRGNELMEQGEWAAAVADHTRAIDMIEELKGKYESNGRPFPPDWQNDISLTYRNRCVALWKQGKLAEAIADFRKSIVLVEDIRRQYESSERPFPPDRQIGLIEDYVKMGNALQEQRELAAAVTDYKRAIDLMEELKGQCKSSGRPFPPDWQKLLTLAYTNRLAAATADIRISVDLLEELKGQSELSGRPFPPDRQIGLADAYVIMGNALIRQGKLAAAVTDYKRAIDLLKELKVLYKSSGRPFPPDWQSGLADVYAKMENALIRQGKLAAAVTELPSHWMARIDSLANLLKRLLRGN
jgi:tetratricopeptide (TPR) repeat protein